MLIPISINAQDIADQFDFNEKEIEEVIDLTIKEITGQFAVYWENQAKQNLHSTRSRYIANLKVVDEGRMKGAVVLDYTKDKLVSMIEDGVSAFDLKDGFSKSAKKTIKKSGDGWFLTIPFSWGTPGSIGESTSIAARMPSEVYALIKNKANKESIKKTELPKGLQVTSARKEVSTTIPESKTFKEYQHKSSNFAGITKSTSAITGQSSYTSFRRVSDKSDDNSWIHSGIVAHNLAEKAYEVFETRMEDILTASIDDAISKLI